MRRAQTKAFGIIALQPPFTRVIKLRPSKSRPKPKARQAKRKQQG
jgi:hypothetical protein